MFTSVFKEYKSLIEQADAYFETQEVQVDGQKEFLENSSYNGYGILQVELFQVKLRSLSIIIEYYIKSPISECMYFEGDYINIKQTLKDLEKKFTVTNSRTTHNNFVLKKADSMAGIDINEYYYNGFISSAYKSIAYLNTFSDNEKAFNALFIGDMDTILRNTEMVRQSFIVLNITNEYRECILSPRKAAVLWGLIDVLKERNWINILTQEQCISIFWIYVKGQGEAPKAHRESKNYLRTKADVKTILDNLLRH
ncbi:hypothetical protein [Pedobacter hartonius]|uniref:Uncharacterized protein n=1 Tax=Pedobacter hartonius TaxID=425514 RepID=A0A1H3Z1S6_9SPHI|nr:hypothetical protein [Pedobacter hartonius]SEA17695.1 hypothetical protein SAMN05443550_102207 [Pedobacter hartonius]